MPVSVRPKNGRYRIVEPDGSIATTEHGNARDGGGHPTYERALRQMRAINMHLREGRKSYDKSSLYIYRPLISASELIMWAVKSGFNTLVPHSDMHVTIAYSKAELSWATIPFEYRKVIVDGGFREIKRLGDKGAIVLCFESKELHHRWKRLKELGASWDWPSFQPHVTLTYSGDSFSNEALEKMEPYEGVLWFGAEHWNKVDDDWKDRVRETKIRMK